MSGRSVMRNGSFLMRNGYQITNGIAMIIHGYNLHEPDWEYVVYGDPKLEFLGRATMGVWQVLRYKPDLILWNIGCSEIDGVIEAQYTLDYTLRCLAGLSEDFPTYFGGLDVDRAAAFIKAVSVVETESTNTYSSMEKAIPFLLTEDGFPRYSMAFHISSPNHVFRCTRDAMTILWEKGLDPQRHLQMLQCCSHTCYGGGRIEDVEIYELGVSSPK